MAMNRRDVLKGALAAGAAAAWPAAGRGAAAEGSRRPNILYILVDQWRAFATGYAGDPNARTPHLDRLQSQSVDFRNAVSVCPVCTPHRAALMTGRYPTATGMFLNDLYLPESELCLAEIFQAGGYRTGYIGKWHLDGHGRKAFVAPPRRQGWDYWKAAECDHDYNHSHYYFGDSDDIHYWEGYDSYAQTRDAQAQLKVRAGEDKPFFLMVSYGTPHFPHHTAPKDLIAQYPPDKIQLRPNVPEAMQARARKESSGYYAHCAALDKCLGDLMQTLEQTGLAGNTIVVFTSDHGEMMGSQGRPPCQKQTPWDESIRVPFLIRVPAGAEGKSGGRLVQAPIDTPDILPTLLGLAGLDVPKCVQGEDLAALVRGTGGPADRPALVMNVSPFGGNQKDKEFRGIRTARYSYIRSLEGPWLLYDNQADPCQMNNLAGRAEHAKLQDELEQQLQAEMKKHNVDFRPRQAYLDEWGYQVTRTGIIGYGDKREKVQSPRRKM